ERGLAGRAELDIAAVAGAGRGRARRGGRRHRARRRRRAGGLAAEVAQLLEGADDRLELLRARLQPELDLRPLDQTADVALAVHRARDGVLDLVEAERVAGVRIGHLDEALAAVVDGPRDQVGAKERALGHGRLLVIHRA